MNVEAEKDIPELPLKVIEASKNNTLILFLGAGLSCAAGMISWDKLKEIVLESYHPKDEEIKFEMIKSWPIPLILDHINDYDQKLYFKILGDYFIPKEENFRKFKELYNFLLKLNPRSLVSLNIDPLLTKTHQEYSGNFSQMEECIPWFIKDNHLFNFHGLYDPNCQKHVLTGNEYQLRYSNDNAKRFLYNIFGGYFTVLFIGFSFRDEDIMKLMELPKSIRELAQKEGPLHFALLPNNFDKVELLKYKNGIESLCYKILRDSNSQNEDHINFINTLKNWEKQLSVKKPSFGLENAQTPKGGPNEV